METKTIKEYQDRLNQLYKLKNSIIKDDSDRLHTTYDEAFLEVYPVYELRRWVTIIKDEILTINYRIGRIQRDMLLNTLK